jgi:hypothetical protein
MFCDEHGTANFCPDCMSDLKDERIAELRAENATLREVVHLFTDNDSVQVHQPFECEAAEAALEK